MILNHGCICSCLGPIIDVQMKSKVFSKEKFMMIQLVLRDVFLPSVYDALLVIRPSTHFRDGRVIQNYTCLLYTSPSPRDRTRSRMPSSA